MMDDKAKLGKAMKIYNLIYDRFHAESRRNELQEDFRIYGEGAKSNPKDDGHILRELKSSKEKIAHLNIEIIETIG